VVEQIICPRMSRWLGSTSFSATVGTDISVGSNEEHCNGDTTATNLVVSMDFVSEEHGVPHEGPKDSNAGVVRVRSGSR
jgi:hypothetical protein